MLTFIINRFISYLITIWIVFTISFFLMRFVPGGPFDGERALDPEIQKNIEARYKTDRPLFVQYFYHLGNALRFDFGPSYRLADFTVNEIIAQGFPVSASLGIIALNVALFVGLLAGIVSAVWPRSFFDRFLMALATLGIAIPLFTLACIPLMIFVFILKLLPAGGWGTIDHLILPGICLGAPYAAYIARLTRTGLLETINQDYIRTAYAKGLTSRQVILKHALRGALLPVLSYLGPAIAGILIGSVVIEDIFAIPGLGTHFLNAAFQRDYTLAMGLVLLYTTLLYSMNFLVDVSYRLVDPRVTLE